MSAKKTRIVLVSILAAVCIFFVIEKTLLPGLSQKSKNSSDYRLLGMTMRLVREAYVEDINPSKTMEGAYKSLIDSLDSFSSYLDQIHMQRFKIRRNPALKDIGIVLYKKFGSYPQIVGMEENSPAQEKGLKIGDIISYIDGRSTLSLSMREINLYLRNTKAENVRLQVLGAGQNNEEISIEQKRIHRNSFELLRVEKTSGILRIHNLFSPYSKKIKQKLSKLRSVNSPLILDLRNCFQGDIEEAVQLINFFLKNENVGYLGNKFGPTQYLACREKPLLDRTPLVIWTNSATFGVSEIVAGVLQNFNRAKIIGLKTLGLAANQKVFEFDDGTGLILTTEVYHFPSGEKLWQKGLEPDVKMDVRNLSTSAYLEQTFNLLSGT
jgi:C-terminal peptidase prc